MTHGILTDTRLDSRNKTLFSITLAKYCQCPFAEKPKIDAMEGDATGRRS
jgi:hypothetical protein